MIDPRRRHAQQAAVFLDHRIGRSRVRGDRFRIESFLVNGLILHADRLRSAAAEDLKDRFDVAAGREQGVDQRGRHEVVGFFKPIFKMMDAFRQLQKSHASGRALKGMETARKFAQRLALPRADGQAENERLDALEEVGRVGQKRFFQLGVECRPILEQVSRRFDRDRDRDDRNLRFLFHPWATGPKVCRDPGPFGRKNADRAKRRRRRSVAGKKAKELRGVDLRRVVQRFNALPRRRRRFGSGREVGIEQREIIAPALGRFGDDRPRGFVGGAVGQSLGQEFERFDAKRGEGFGEARFLKTFVHFQEQADPVDRLDDREGSQAVGFRTRERLKRAAGRSRSAARDREGLADRSKSVARRRRNSMMRSRCSCAWITR